MAKIIETITLDLARANLSVVVYAKQKDCHTRQLKVHFTVAGASYPVPAGHKVLLGVTRVDGSVNTFEGELDETDGTALINLPGWALERPGRCTCDVGLIEGDAQLSSFPFILEVRAGACNGETIEDQDPGLLPIIARLGAVKIEAGEGLDSVELGTDLEATADYSLAQGFGEIIKEADSSSAGAYFDELAKIGVVTEGEVGKREVKVGKVSGYCSLALLNSIADGDFALAGGRGTYVRGRGATGLGYQIVIDAQDGTSLGQRNFIRNYRAGCAVGFGNLMNPDGNADGDAEPSNGVILGAYSQIHADSCVLAGIYGNFKHEHVYGLGRYLISAGKRQLLMGFRPSAQANTLVAIGDGTDTQGHNAMVIYQNAEGRATQGWFNYKVDVEGYVYSHDVVKSAKAPTADIDCVRLLEYKALLARVEALEKAAS